MSRSTMKFNSDNSRAARFLGIDYDHVIANIFPTSKEQAASGGKLLRGDFLWFWGQMSSGNASQAGSYLLTLLEQLKSALDSRTPPIHNVSVDSMVNTISLLILYNQLPIDVTPVKTFISNWQSSNQEGGGRENYIINNISRLLNIRLQTDLDVMLTSLIIGISTLLSHKELTLSVSKQCTYDESDIQSNEMAYAYSFLMSTLRSLGTQCQLNILNTTLNKTLTLSQQMKVNPLLAQTTLLSLMHVMKQSMSFDSISNVAFLKRAINTIQPYYFWPQPYSSIVRDVMERIQCELLLPGWNRRDLVLQESSVVDYNGRNCDHRCGYAYTKPIFYLYDNEDTTCLTTLSMLDPVEFTAANMVNANAELVVPLGIMCMSIFHAINTDCPSTEDDLEKMKFLSTNQVLEFYDKLQAIEQNICKNANKSKINRTAELTALKTSIQQACNASTVANPHTYFSPVNTTTNPFCPPLPPVEHIRIPLILRSKLSEHEKPGVSYPAAAVYSKLFDLISGYYNPNIKHIRHLREIKLVIVGNEALTQHIVVAYLALMNSSPQFFTQLKLKFYIAPCTKNTLAGYIARHDPWYLRHVYTPLRSNCFLVPWKKDDDNDLKPNGSSILPTNFLHECIEQYAREAECVTNVQLYKMECFLEVKKDNIPDEIIPFMQRVEIGLPAVAEEYRFRNRKPVGSKLEDIIKDKGFAFQSLDVTVKFTRQDLSGLTQTEVTDEVAPYMSILMANVPRTSDACFPPDLTAEAFEMVAVPHKDKGKYKKNVLSAEPRQHVAKVSIISGNSQKFHVLADGILYGPYAAITVSPATDTQGKPARFPVQTFFPVNP